MYLISLLFMGTFQSSLITFHSFASANRLTLGQTDVGSLVLALFFTVPLGTWMELREALRHFFGRAKKLNN